MEEFKDQFSEIASLFGDKARAIMLWHLLDGRAYTATELSVCAGISAQSASNHLAKLINSSILTVVKQGRHRYYTYANPESAQVVESMAGLLPLNGEFKKIKRPELVGFTYARTCYDHLAGKAGVDIAESMQKNKIIESSGNKYTVTPLGKEWFRSLEINIDELRYQKRSFAHQCLDWSERRHHLAGALGASMLQVMLKKDWLRRKANSREILVTTKGKLELKLKLNLEV